MNPKDWPRNFETLNTLWNDYQDALRDHKKRRTWTTWLNLVLAKSTYETYRDSL